MRCSVKLFGRVDAFQASNENNERLRNEKEMPFNHELLLSSLIDL